MRKREPSYTVGGHANRCSHHGEEFGGASRELNIELSFDTEIPFLAWECICTQVQFEKIHVPICS